MGPESLFMSLPTDLKLKILESLPGVDIVKLGGLCSELRYLCSDLDLWKRKFGEDFGKVVKSDSDINWKEKYAESWVGRERRVKQLAYLEEKLKSLKDWKRLVMDVFSNSN
ncbi:F-box protein [Actinidia chinensis var. chinensis]|uniref:F-box protein n=1 Tax=Actinidia chinensis var. chinensis TaxID=1590841 RepID=A0A2R6Q644_ACTCC|nr:F-box protein [Actinidia chinensis var. chinensis]